jgi:RND family efflux transporter MFP subunit
MRRSTKIILGVVIVFFAIGIITFLNRTRGKRKELVSAVKRDRSPVRTLVASPTSLTRTINNTGTVAARGDVILTSEVAGKVIRLGKGLGDRCRKGELLIQLDPESYRIALLQADAGLKQARVQVQQARRDLERARKLRQRSALAAASVEQTETALLLAQARVKLAEAGVRMARRNLRKTTVRCPFDGVVAERMVELGQLVGQTSPLARLVDRSRLKLTVRVSAAELKDLQEDQIVDLSDMSGGQYQGKVARLGVAGDPVSHTFPVELEVPVVPGGPRPGQMLRASIQVAHYNDVLAVPEGAVLEGHKLVLYRDGKAATVAVTLGARVDGQVVVASGLSPGDEVVVVGHHGLKPGSRLERVARSDARATAAAQKPAKAAAGASRKD